MDTWGAVVGLGLIAVTVGVIAFVRYRERETRKLQGDVALALELRSLAGDDAVRLAAVDEFELAIYQRLFFASVVAPRIRSAAWSLLGTVFAVVAVLVTASGGGLTFDVVHIAALALAVIFGLATLVFTVLALYNSATTPRVSFAESYAAE
ncbi:hypothetical protein ACWDTI_12085 [Gordonia sp. NPDC003424]